MQPTAQAVGNRVPTMNSPRGGERSHSVRDLRGVMRRHWAREGRNRSAGFDGASDQAHAERGCRSRVLPSAGPAR